MTSTLWRVRSHGPRWALPVAAAALWTGLVGCGGPASEIQLVSYKDPYFPEPYRVSFSDCAYRVEPGGDYHVVARGVNESADPERGPIAQYVHVHVFWKPWPGKTFADSTTTDATLRYVVVTDAGTAAYSGTGFIFLKHARMSDKLIAAIEDARLRPEASAGNPVDLLGVSRLSGTLSAVNDASLAMDLLHEMNLPAAGRNTRSADSP